MSPRQVRSQNFTRNVSRLKLFPGTNEALLRRQRAPILNTFGVFPWLESTLLVDGVAK
jgi:hypothetical protein